jgi:PAS domain S-box-containing protein
MKQKWDGIEQRRTLRANAEVMVAGVAPAEEAARPADVLMHELLVHKVELEIQNEELRRAYAELEEAKDRYVSLYEFAPVGYVTLGREGLINEINLTGSALLGVDRAKLINRRFSSFIEADERDRWHRLFLNMMEQAEGEKKSFGLRMTNADGMMFPAHLNCLRRENAESAPVLWVALTDVSKI